MTLFVCSPDGYDGGSWGSHWQAVDDAFGAPDDGTTAVTWDGTANGEARYTLTGIPSVSSISRVTVYFRTAEINPNGQVAALVKVGGVTYYGSYVGMDGEWTTNLETWLLNPNTGVAWTSSDVNALIAGVRANTVSGSPQIDLTQVVIEVDAVALPSKIGAARHRGSIEVHLRRSALPSMVTRSGLLLLDRDLLDQAPWMHYAGPTTKDEGWGIKPWQRRLGALLSSDFDMDALEVTVRDFDLRRYLVSYRDTAQSEEAPSTQYQGLLRLDAGAGRVFSRATRAWILNPAAGLQGIVQVVGVAVDQEKLASHGELIEPLRINILLRSSLKDGLTGLTAVGTASQSTADTTDLLFESAESGNSLKITRNATAEDQGRTWPTTSARSANERVVLSIDYKNDSGVALSWYLQRSTDSNYYRDSDGTWQGTIQYNALPVTTSIGQFVSKVIDVGSGTPTLTLSVVHRSADANGTISHAYHHQIESGRSATSRILTQASEVTRNADNLKIENFTGKFVYDPARLTGYVEVRPNFNSADLASGAVLTVFMAFKDASNYDWLFYDQTSASFIFRRRLSGSNYNATFAQALTRGTVYKLGFRATGTDAEEDLAAYTLSVFVGGVKGTDAIPAGTWTPGASEYLYIGQDNAGANLWDGHLRQWVVRPFVFADAEMVDQP